MAQIRYGLIRQTEEDLNKITAEFDGKTAAGKAGDGKAGARSTRMLKEEVTAEDIAGGRAASRLGLEFRAG